MSYDPVKAIEALQHGIFDDPDLVAFGPLSTTADDVLEIKKAHLKANGYFIGCRDPRINHAHAGVFMIVDNLESWDLQPTSDAGNGPWAIVGDDLPDLIDQAFQASTA